MIEKKYEINNRTINDKSFKLTLFKLFNEEVELIKFNDVLFRKYSNARIQ